MPTKATTTTMTKAEIARKKRLDDALDAVKKDSAEIRKLEKQIERINTRVGKAALKAQKNGARYADIGDAAQRSSAWVQHTLVKAGYEPRQYKKRDEDGDE